MNVSTHCLFIRTYYRDAERLYFCLSSVRRFCRGIKEVVVVCSPSSKRAISSVVSQFPGVVLKLSQDYENDYVGQQLDKLNVFNYTQCDFIINIDSDCIFVEDFDPGFYFRDGKPLLYHREYNFFYKNKITMPWQGITSRVLCQQVDYEFMALFPLVHPRKLYIAVDRWVAERHGGYGSIISTLSNPNEFSEFNILGAFSYYEIDGSNSFHLHINWRDEEPKRFAKQYCLTSGQHNRSIDKHEYDELSEITGAKGYLNSNEEVVAMDKIENAAIELQSFKDANLWEGGFMDCDPLHPLAWSSYTTNGFVSIYHALYFAAIKPYMPKNACALEIGPGHGSWTRALLKGGAAKVIGLDVQSREFNGIDNWLKDDAINLEYHVVDDLSCSMVPDHSIDFFWSGGAFVHMSPAIQEGYITSIFNKMKPGAFGFIQYADMDVWNNIVQSDDVSIHALISNVIGSADGQLIRQVMEKHDAIRARAVVPEVVRTWDAIAPGRYYYVGQDFMQKCVATAGFEVIDATFMPSLRDPVIHFRKP